MSDTTTSRPSQGTYTFGTETTVRYTAAKTWQYVGSTYQTFVNLPLPSQLAVRNLVSARLIVTTYPAASTSSRALTAQRHAKTSGGYPLLNGANKPGVLAGSTAHTLTQDAHTANVYDFDVFDDLAAIKAGGEYYGWRLTSSFGSKWGIRGVESPMSVQLVVELASPSNRPTGLAPDGVTALSAPVLTWDATNGLVSAQAQITEAPVGAAEPDFTTPDFDTTRATTVAQLDLAAAGWTGQSSGSSVAVRIRRTDDGGLSEWSDPILITRRTLAAFAFTGSGTTNDPNPAAQWSMTGQTAFQIITSVDGVVVANTGKTPGADTAYAPPVGATKPGQVITFEGRGWDSYDADRTPSPGDTGYSKATQNKTYNPGTDPAVTALSVAQVGTTPLTQISWSYTTIPDEWLIVRGGVIVDRFDAISGGSPAPTAYTDYSCPPNTTLTYDVLAFTANQAGASSGGVTIRTKVDGAWLFEPVAGGPMFRVRGATEEPPTWQESTVWYVPLFGDHEIKRTFGLRGQSGDIGGMLEQTGRTLAQMSADVWAIKSHPSRGYRCAFGDQNIPVAVSDINPVLHEIATTERIVKRVSYHIAQIGELPFEPPAP